ncbi:MAG: hypothetical protein KDJ65_29550 [Anaerolineae bacterium]|nr:hypothetical protein [Anaerolineae bacterium]
MKIQEDKRTTRIYSPTALAGRHLHWRSGASVNRPGYEQRPLKTGFANPLERVPFTSPVDLSPGGRRGNSSPINSLKVI